MNSVVISLVAPCLNEQDNVVELAERFFAEAAKKNITVEIVLIDDGSTDQTWTYMTHLQDMYGEQIQIIRNIENLGISASWQLGVTKALGEFVCLIDSDLQNPPEVVFHLLRALEGNTDVLAQGVRRPVKQQPKSRILMSRTLNWILNFIFGMNSADNKSGFVLGSKSTILKIITHKNQYQHYQTFIGIAAHSHGINVVEVDTPFEDRRHGVSFLSGKSLTVVIQVFRDVATAIDEFGSRYRKRKFK